jgi:hypothetical protein
VAASLNRGIFLNTAKLAKRRVDRITTRAYLGAMIGSILQGGSAVRSMFASAGKQGGKESSNKSKLQPNRGKAGDNSPQANYEERLASGISLTPEEILEAKRYAASIDTTFNATTGYGQPGAYRAKLGQDTGNVQIGRGSGATANDVKVNKFIPFDVRKIQARGGPRNEKEAGRMARFQSSTMGQRLSQSSSASQPTEQPTDAAQPSQQPQRTSRQAKAYRANLGKAWGNALDEKDDATRQAKKAGISVAARNAAVAKGQERLNTYRAKIGAPQQQSGPKPAENQGGTPEYFFAEGNADGSVSTYQGQSGRVAEARGREVVSEPSRPQLASSPASKKKGGKKEFRARI